MEDNGTINDAGELISVYEAAKQEGLRVVDKREFKNFVECDCSCIRSYFGSLSGGSDPMPIFCCKANARCGWGYRTGGDFVIVDFPSEAKVPELNRPQGANFRGRDLTNGGFRLR